MTRTVDIGQCLHCSKPIPDNWTFCGTCKSTLPWPIQDLLASQRTADRQAGIQQATDWFVNRETGDG